MSAAVEARNVAWAGHRSAPWRLGWWLLHIGAPLAVGALVYVMLRRQPVVFLRWLQPLGIQELVSTLHEAGAPWRGAAPAWVNNHLPDGLFAYSACCFFGAVWRATGARRWLPGALLGLGGVIALEGMQHVGWMSGRADVWDVAWECAAFGLAALQFHLGAGKEEP
jgi:hypothetical protein